MLVHIIPKELIGIAATQFRIDLVDREAEGLLCPFELEPFYVYDLIAFCIPQFDAYNGGFTDGCLVILGSFRGNGGCNRAVQFDVLLVVGLVFAAFERDCRHCETEFQTRNSKSCLIDFTGLSSLCIGCTTGNQGQQVDRFVVIASRSRLRCHQICCLLIRLVEMIMFAVRIAVLGNSFPVIAQGCDLNIIDIFAQFRIVGINERIVGIVFQPFLRDRHLQCCRIDIIFGSRLYKTITGNTTCVDCQFVALDVPCTAGLGRPCVGNDGQERAADGGTRNSLFEHERRSLDIAVGNDRRRNVVANGCSFFGNIPILFGSRSNSGRFRRGIDLHFLVA